MSGQIPISPIRFTAPDGAECIIPGITYRQYLAAKAMQGILANADSGYLLGDNIAEQIASESFIYADALIAHEDKERREKGGQQG